MISPKDNGNPITNPTNPRYASSGNPSCNSTCNPIRSSGKPVCNPTCNPIRSSSKPVCNPTCNPIRSSSKPVCIPTCNPVRYHSLNNYLKERFHEKVYRLALDGGMTCPNRDGLIGRGGCIFCSGGGSGEFAEKADLAIHTDNSSSLLMNPCSDFSNVKSSEGCQGAKPDDGEQRTTPNVGGKSALPYEEGLETGFRLVPLGTEFIFHSHTLIYIKGQITRQIEAAKSRIRKKTDAGKYIAYFQSFTNTYAPVEYLEKIFTEAILHPEVVVLSIGTRPDCLQPEIVDLLARLNQIKPVWVELGLQTIHESTAAYIRRGYPLSVYEDAVRKLHAAKIEVITHVILGLPGESKEDILATCAYLGSDPDLQPEGVKLQLLHVLKGTDLAIDYEAGKFEVLSMEDYLSLLVDCVKALPSDIIIHRLTGDGDKKLLVAPLWSGDKKRVLNAVNQILKPW